MKQFSKYWLLASALLLVLILPQACKVGPNLTEHPMDLPGDYAQDTLAPDTADVIAWWDLFDDPVLDSLIRLALDTNKNLLQTAQRVEQARLQTRIAKGNFGPQINISSSVIQGNYFNLPLSSGTAESFFGGGNFSWELDFWGKYRRLSENAKATYVQSMFAQRALQISLISEVATQYFNMLENQAALNISLQTLELRQQTLDVIEARYREGISGEIDLNQSQIQYAIAKGAVPYYRQLYLSSQLALRVLLGQLPGAISTDKSLQDISLEIPIPPGVPAQLIAQRPDIQEAWYAAVAQNALIGVAQANRFPSISLSGTLGVATTDLSSFAFSNPSWNVGAGLLAPLFHWNQNLRRVQSERAGTMAALYAYENQVLISLAEVESSLIAISANEERIKANRLRSIAALNALNLSDQRYIRGVTSYLEYLESQRQAFDAQLAEVGAEADLLRSYLELYKALGGGWITPEEKAAAEEAQEENN